MNPESARCTTCGSALEQEASGLGSVCPACLLRASCSPDRPVGGLVTNWEEVFPQFQLGRLLWNGDGLHAWEAEELDRNGHPVVLQVVCGERLTEAGGAEALLKRANRLRDLDLPGLARVLDAGDLSDAFFLVTQRGASWTPVTDNLESEANDKVNDLIGRVASLVAAARSAGQSIEPDLRSTYLDPATDQMMLTPSIVPPDLESELAALQPVTPAFVPGSGVALDGFTLEEKIGEGGFGEVWRARQSHPVKRQVAVKILKHGLASPRLLARFEAEQQALARLEHPQIARFFDGDTTPDGRPYFAMEWVDGESIVDRCRKTQAPLEERLRLFRKLCEAVHHAHQKGIIHRDLKSSNVMVTTVGGSADVKVIDFGIARAIEEPLTDQTLLTRAEETLGTPATMSPEQAAGGDLDARTDVYGLGVLLYELLTDTLPFDSSLPSDELRRMIRDDNPPRPSSRSKDPHHQRHLRGDLDWITLRCLEKDPERRYRSVNALLRDLERHAHNEPVDAGPPELAYRAGKFIRRNRAAVVATATVVLALLTATVVSWNSALQARKAEKRADRSLQNLQIAYGEAESARNSSQELLVNTLLAKGTRQFNEGDVTGLIALQEAVTAAEGNPLLEEKALELWTLARAWLPGSVEAVFDEPYAVALSPDESVVAWCDDTHLHFHEIASGEQTTHELDPELLELTPSANGDHLDVLAMAFGSDGHHLAIHNPELGVGQVWDPVGRKAVTGLLRHPGPASRGYTYDVGMCQLAFSPDGISVATLARNGSACLWSIPEGALAVSPWQSQHMPRSVAFSPSGLRIAIGYYNNGDGDNVLVFDLADPVHPIAKTTTDFRANKLHFVDEDRLWIRGSNHVYFWEVATGHLQETQGGFYEALEASADHELVAIGDRTGEAQVLHAETFQPAGSPLKHGGGGVRSLAFGPDCKLLATGGLDGTVQFWGIEQERNARIATWPQPGSLDQAVSGPRRLGRFVSKSRTRNYSQPVAGILRHFPPRIWERVAELPPDVTLMDVSANGHRLLLRSADRRSLGIWKLDERGQLSPDPQWSRQPTTLPPGDITTGSLGPDGESLVFCHYPDDHPTTAMVYLSTSAVGEELIFKDETGDSALRVGSILSTNPRLASFYSLPWRTRLLNLGSTKPAREIRLDGRVAGVVEAPELGWYGVASQSGTIQRFGMQNHMKLPPAIHSDQPLIAAACSHDHKWLMVEARPPDIGERSFSAFSTGYDSRFFSVTAKMGGSTGEDRAFIARKNRDASRIIVGMHGRVFPISDRSFIYQHGTEVRRTDLPKVTIRPDQVQAATQAALGVRKDEHGELRVLTSAEFRAARAGAE